MKLMYDIRIIIYSQFYVDLMCIRMYGVRIRLLHSVVSFRRRLVRSLGLSPALPLISPSRTLVWEWRKAVCMEYYSRSNSSPKYSSRSMTLEDFEKSLLEGRDTQRDDNLRNNSEEKNKKRRKHHHHHRDHHVDGDEQHRSKRSRQSRDASKCQGEGSTLLVHEEKNGRIDGYGIQPRGEDQWTDKTAHESKLALSSSMPNYSGLKRDSWMEAPSGENFEYTHKGVSKSAKNVITSGSLKADFQLKIHENELNKHHLEDLAEGRDTATNTTVTDSTQSGHHDEVDYTFGDEGAQWRMTKLKAIYRQAEDLGRPVEDIAIERYGALRAFDDAREEQIELDRRETYGDGYVIKKKPNGELSKERTREEEREGRTKDRSVEPPIEGGKQRNKHADNSHDGDRSRQSQQLTTQQVDHKNLNRLKAQLLKARLRGTPDVPTLEAEYAQVMDSVSSQSGPRMVVLGAMENRMLAGGRQGEVSTINTKRGRERGLVRDNEDMSIEDMVKEERRTRNQAGGDGKRFAERIAKDGKFDVNSKTSSPILHPLTISFRMISITWKRMRPSWQNAFTNRRSALITQLFPTFRR